MNGGLDDRGQLERIYSDARPIGSLDPYASGQRSRPDVHL